MKHAVETELDPVLEKLATFTNASAPVVSLYLDLGPDQQGRRDYENFLNDAFSEQIESFPAGSEARLHLETDIRRARQYLDNQLRPGARTVAIFSSSGEPSLFEAVQVDAPIEGHRLYVDRAPHLFPLARLNDQYTKHAALVLDTHSARLYVFAIGAPQRKLAIESEKPERVLGGWMSEPRYQRSVENLHLKHMKEVAEAVERVVREEGVQRVLVAADRVALPLLKEQLSTEVQNALLELDGIDMKSSDADVLRASLAAFREADVLSDIQLVEVALGAFRARGLGTIGLERVRFALQLGQVDRLLVPAVPATTSADEASTAVEAGVSKWREGRLNEKTIEELIRLARGTDASVAFIEEGALLESAGGVAAMLRFRLKAPSQVA